MPKTKVERNRAYRQRLRAKARAWEYIERAVEMMRNEGYSSGNVAAHLTVKAVDDARKLVEQANG